jgi:hypothetical protein
MKDYHSKKAKAHVKHLRKLGFHVIDPSGEDFEKKVNQMKKKNKTGAQVMEWFVDYVNKYCDHLAFSPTDEGKVSAGVWQEIEAMKNKGGMVIQMPDLDKLEVMTVEETRQYLKS